jgi:hypothetical protein
MPVAQPGCPMDHIQASANRSPGDLWLRCIGTILHRRFGYLAVPDMSLSAIMYGNCRQVIMVCRDTPFPESIQVLF